MPLIAISDDFVSNYARKDVLFWSAGTGEDVDLEVLVDDFITFYMAGEQSYELCISVSMPVDTCERYTCILVLFFIFSGQDTTCILLSFAVVLLHLNPDILER